MSTTSEKYSVRPALSASERAPLDGFSDVTAHLLFHRGIKDAENARNFISPDYSRDVHDPLLLKDAEKAAERILEAIKNKERIAIYADYDADGIPGAVIWNDFLKRIGYENFRIYIPHRHNEGFGLNDGAIDELADDGVDLVITVDCGISDKGPVQRAVEKGMDVIITDHHEPPASADDMPPAVAIVDHKQSDCLYPDKNICGSGVAFKVIQAVIAKSPAPLIKDGHEKWFLDMVGIATLSDMVPLVGENRAFAHYGLAVLRKSPRKGLMRLFDKLRMSQRHLTEDDIAFMITPRINAASRMGVPMDAFNLLSATDELQAEQFATRLEEVNSERKGVVASLVKEVKHAVRERHIGDIPSVIVLGNPEWRPSLLGLVANSCAEEFNRPVFLWGRDGENAIKGSCRSEGVTHVVELMRAVPAGVFTEFGGHKYSGGFAVSSDAVHYLEQKLVEAADIKKAKDISVNNIADENIENMANIADMELCLDDVRMALWDEISKLSPFGIGNPKPLFLFKRVAPTSIRRFGKGNDHVEIQFANSNGGKVPAISFFGATSPWASLVEAGKPLDLVASLEKSMFRGRAELRLRIEDVMC